MQGTKLFFITRLVSHETGARGNQYNESGSTQQSEESDPSNFDEISE
jgi:hypothetical protein